MKVVIQGFSFQPGKIISKNEYLDYLASCDEGDFEFANKRRIFRFLDSGNPSYWAGVLISFKDHKTFCALKDSTRIIIHEAGNDEQLMDFNYFVINKKSFRGLYQTYFHSCSLNQFGIFLKQRYNTQREEKILTEIESKSFPNSVSKEKAKSKLEYDFGAFRISPEVKEESFQNLIDELDEISSFEYSLHTVQISEDTYTPLKEFAKKTDYRTVFSRDVNLASLVRGIQNFVATRGILKGRVIGYDPEGLQKKIDILENPDFLAEHEFDDVTRNIEGLEIGNLSNNWVVNELLSVATENNLEIAVI